MKPELISLGGSGFSVFTPVVMAAARGMIDHQHCAILRYTDIQQHTCVLA